MTEREVEDVVIPILFGYVPLCKKVLSDKYPKFKYHKSFEANKKHMDRRTIKDCTSNGYYVAKKLITDYPDAPIEYIMDSVRGAIMYLNEIENEFLSSNEETNKMMRKYYTFSPVHSMLVGILFNLSVQMDVILDMKKSADMTEEVIV